MQVTFDHSKDEATNVTTFFFKPPQPLRYTAGQFIELTLPHEQPDDRGIKRWFTLSSAPEQEFVSITTRLTTNHGSTFKSTLRSLSQGTQVHMSDPMGDFVLPKLVQTPLVLVAGGIGITPFHSMLEWLANTKETRPITLIHGVNIEDDIIFQPTFERAGVHATIVVEQPSSAWGGERGRLNAELVLGLAEVTDDSLVYLSGPEPMIEALMNDFANHGMPKSQLVGDYFPGYPGV